MKRMALFSIFAAMVTGSHAASNDIDHAQPRPPSTVKAQVTTITETYVSDGTTTTLRDSHSSQPELQIMESSATSALPPAQIFDQFDLNTTLQRINHYIGALHQAKNILAAGADADALAHYASQAEALAHAAGQMERVAQMQRLRATAYDLQFAITQQDSVKARALIGNIHSL